MIEGDDRELFATTLDGVVIATGPALDAALAEIGWSDALDDDPRSATSLLFERQGRHAATSSALDAVLRAALVGAGDLPDGAPVVLPPIGSTREPGRLDGDTVAVAGLAMAGVTQAQHALVVTGGGAESTLHVVATADLRRRPVGGLDRALGLVEVHAEGLTAEPTTLSPTGWSDAVAAGQRALAHELVGASRTMLGLARDHAVERIQFGHPIARFQAVRHRLAEALVAIESAEGVADAAWEEGTPFAASAAKAVAGRSARVVAKHAQQVLAGIGFTAEHDLHRFVRRVLALDGLLGDARSLTTAMGEQLLVSRALPKVLPL